MSSTFKSFQTDDIVLANATEVTIGLWPGGTGSLALFYTGSQAIDTSGQYYWNAYNVNPVTSASIAEVCFAVAYGHRLGYGHPTLVQSDTSTLATQAVYSQYRNLLLDPGDTQFTFDGSVNSDNIYVINVQRALMKERLDPGNWILTLSGSKGIRTFIDDSGQALGAAFGKSGQVFNVASGSLTGTSGSTIVSTTSTTKGGFGLCYPSLGVIVLNPDAIAETVGFAASAAGKYSASAAPVAPYTGSCTDAQYNHKALYSSINLGGDFQARSSENISSTHYFVRLRAAEFNYSNNPTFFDETNGTLIYTAFIQDPRVYVTTVGLYNNSNELLAVAKLSKPVQKSFASELNLRTRLDF